MVRQFDDGGLLSPDTVELRALLLFGPPALGDVSRDGDHELPALGPAVLSDGERNLHREDRAIPSQAGQIEHAADRSAGLPGGEIALHVPRMLLPVVLGHQTVERLSEHLLACAAEHLFRRRVENRDQPLLRDRDHGILGSMDHFEQQAEAVLQRVFRLLLAIVHHVTSSACRSEMRAPGVRPPEQRRRSRSPER